MRKHADLIPYVLSIAGILGLVMIILASTDVIYRRDAARPRSPDTEQDASPTPSTTPRVVSQTIPPPESTPTVMPTVKPSVTPTPTSLPTPTPVPIAVSPPFVSSTGALAYVEDGVLIVINPGTYEVTMVAEGVSHGAHAVVWSPDGRQLLYATGTSGPGGDSESGHRSFFVWDSQSDKTLNVRRDVAGFSTDASSIEYIAWSPKGTRILFGSRPEAPSQGTWILDVLASRAWRSPKLSTNSMAWIDEDTVLCKDGEAVTSRLVSVAPSTRTLTNTLTVTGTYSLSRNQDYVASFKQQRGGGHRLDIQALPGHVPLSWAQQPVITAPVHTPLWSPDGQWVAYAAEGLASSNEGGPYTLLAETERTGGVRSFLNLLPVAWSPDSRLLAGFGCEEATCHLSVVDPVSGQMINIASREDLHLRDLAWSPGGVYMAYSTSGSWVDMEGLALWNRTTNEKIQLIRADEERPLTDLQWSADGCFLYGAQREKREEDKLAVSVIRGIGPNWEDLWHVAPGSFHGSAGLVEAVHQGAGGQGPGLCPGPLLNDRRLIAYYGTPLGPGLGILGRYGISETLGLLQEQTQVYRDLDPDVDTIITFHMVTTIADDFAGSDGDYNHRVPAETIRRWIDKVDMAGGWSILDVQPGRANLSNELDAIESFLLEPGVHLAVDPEFIVSEGEVPGEDLGRISGYQINRIQAQLDRLARIIGRRKMLVIHQFDDRMIDHKEAILDYPLVDLVWDADGFGGPGAKIGDYNQYRTEAGFEYGGFKIFYRYDQPLMTPEDVLSLDPPPRLVIYQ